MREGRPSLTATIVASARALAGVDPLAERLVPRGVASALSVVKTFSGRGASRVVELASLGLVEHLSLRTRAIDRVVTDACEGGVRQLVVLGAGLDARAYRLDALREAVVYEVDHPSTQAHKRARAEGVPPLAREVRFVGVDFERDDLVARLGDAGHDEGARTVWVWEGVTPYLTRAAIEASLDVIARRSCPGSVLAVTYGTPDLASVPEVLKPAISPVFSLLGEPLRGLMPSAVARELVERRGFVVEDDARCADYAGRAGQPSPWLSIGERLLVAKKNAG